MVTFAYLIIVLNKYLNLFKTYCYHQANNKAIELSNQGKYSEAIPIAQQALEFAQLLYDGDHPNIAAAVNNLAFIYHKQGQLSQAEYFYQISLNIIRRIFPDDHVHVATSLDNLAGLLHSQGKRYFEKRYLIRD